ncbi:hypothetical protein HAX54_046103, partial [Datura stramonium]|nr:hypothetical protein [Datura stramonium]
MVHMFNQLTSVAVSRNHSEEVHNRRSEEYTVFLEEGPSTDRWTHEETKANPNQQSKIWT